jgi:hypothetical protein
MIKLRTQHEKPFGNGKQEQNDTKIRQLLQERMKPGFIPGCKHEIVAQVKARVSNTSLNNLAGCNGERY